MAIFLTQKQQNRYDMITKCLKQRMRGTHCPVVVVVVVAVVVVVCRRRHVVVMNMKYNLTH